MISDVDCSLAMHLDPRDIEAALTIEHGLEDLPSTDPVQKLAVLVLWQAQRDGASEVVVGALNSDGVAPIRYRVGDALYEMSPLPVQIGAQFVRTVMDMAGLGLGVAFPCRGRIDTPASTKIHLHWEISLASEVGSISFRRA